MNARILALLSLLMLATGCIVHSNGGNNYYPASGNVTLSWTFAGLTCQQAPNVASITVEIPGQVLQPDTYNCLTNNYPGITLTNFDGGDYSYTITAYDYQGYALYTQSGSFTVDGNVIVPVDLSPVSGGSSYALLSWVFGGSQNGQNAPTCGDAQTGDIPTVKVTIDGVPTDYNCTDGLGSYQIQTGGLSPGRHSVIVDAVLPASDPTQDYIFAEGTGIIVTSAGAPASQTFTLNWAVGGAAVNWTFFNGTTQYTSCAAAGVDTLRVNFLDTATQTRVYGADGDVFPCPSNGSNLALYQSLPTGSFQVEVDAYNSAGTILYSNLSDVPTANVQAGIFVTRNDQPSPPIALDLQ